jgi:hypothetical protein
MKEARGLLAIWADVDKDHLIEFQKWHNCQHVAERVSIPGFHVGRRYRGIGEAPDFLMYYETDDSKVMAGKPYQLAINNPTPWTKEVIPHLRNTLRSIYSLVSSIGEKARTDAPYIFLARFNAEPKSENQVIESYQEHFKRILSIPGVYRVRLYVVDDEVSNISTAERKIHGGGPGQQRFLAFYEMADIALPASNAWKEAMEGIEKIIKNVQKESYWLDFVMYAPRGQTQSDRD